MGKQRERLYLPLRFPRYGLRLVPPPGRLVCGAGTPSSAPHPSLSCSGPRLPPFTRPNKHVRRGSASVSCSPIFSRLEISRSFQSPFRRSLDVLLRPVGLWQTDRKTRPRPFDHVSIGLALPPAVQVLSSTCIREPLAGTRPLLPPPPQIRRRPSLVTTVRSLFHPGKASGRDRRFRWEVDGEAIGRQLLQPPWMDPETQGAMEKAWKRGKGHESTQQAGERSEDQVRRRAVEGDGTIHAWARTVLTYHVGKHGRILSIPFPCATEHRTATVSPSIGRREPTLPSTSTPSDRTCPARTSSIFPG